jgi:hypothetical protein
MCVIAIALREVLLYSLRCFLLRKLEIDFILAALI